MKKEIKNIGNIQELDSDGCVINNLSIEKIQSEYALILQEIIDLYQVHFKDVLHSIYIRGSVAKGKAIPHISDIDTVAFIHRDLTEEENEKRSNISEPIQKKYPYATGVEVLMLPIDSIEKSRKIQFLLKTQCLCIYGEDLRANISKQPIGIGSYSHFFSLEKSMEGIKEWRKEKDAPEEERICSWIMKGIVRTGFELVMEKEQCYTRDLYPCYERFSKHYPAQAETMLKVLTLAVYPTNDSTITDDTIEEIKPFLLAEVKKLNSYLKDKYKPS